MASHDIRHDADAGTYTLNIDGTEVGELAYRDAERTRVFTHTRVDEDCRESGLGTALVERALADARDAGLRIDPQCPFVANYVENHDEWQTLVITAQGS